MALTDQKHTRSSVGIAARISDAWLDLALAGAIVAAFIPTLLRLIDGPWRTEQEGHGPIVIAAAAWLAWQARQNFRPEKLKPAYIAGWLVLLAGLALLIVMRSQDVLMLEVAAQIPIICGAVLIAAGWQGLKAYAFPIAFLFFAIPPPGWMMDIFTVPMKLMVSDWATELLYQLDFPIAQNGVMIMVGPYQLMVKDACSGMNSIFALSAIGFFYVHEFIRNSPFRVAVMLAAIIPITVAANFVRVLALILIAYYFGVDAVDGVFHDLTGFLLFAVALGLFFLLDVVLIGMAALAKGALRKWRPHAPAQ
ncbi:exosortase [Rhodoblastus sp.]|uniref:exosortase n=1 Tax=Rhodoblastus sp. TaxID=1962975 RepID=UPI003F9640A5